MIVGIGMTVLLAVGVLWMRVRRSRALVPKRLGVGWTINFGRPAGVAIAVGTLVAIVGVVVLAALQQL